MCERSKHLPVMLLCDSVGLVSFVLLFQRLVFNSTVVHINFIESQVCRFFHHLYISISKNLITGIHV